MTKIASVILAKNEAKHIADCINSLQWSDIIILEDSHSDDGTADLASAKGCLVYQHDFINFSINRNIALQDAKIEGADWVFFIDADERATPELAKEIRQAVQHKHAGWWVPRYNDMWGHVMKGGGWYPDHQLRLLKVGQAHYDPKHEVHEVAEIQGTVGYLQQHMFHYNYESLEHFHRKQHRYALFEAQILHEQGIKAKPWTYVSMPLRETHRRYVTLKGYRDGWRGIQVCALMGGYKFMTYLQLRRLYHG